MPNGICAMIGRDIIGSYLGRGLMYYLERQFGISSYFVDSMKLETDKLIIMPLSLTAMVIHSAFLLLKQQRDFFRPISNKLILMITQ